MIQAWAWRPSWHHDGHIQRYSKPLSHLAFAAVLDGLPVEPLPVLQHPPRLGNVFWHLPVTARWDLPQFFRYAEVRRDTRASRHCERCCEGELPRFGMSCGLSGLKPEPATILVSQANESHSHLASLAPLNSSSAPTASGSEPSRGNTSQRSGPDQCHWSPILDHKSSVLGHRPDKDPGHSIG